MGEREWRPVCDHVTKIEKEYLETEGIIDLEVDRLIINLGGSASDSTEIRGQTPCLKRDMNPKS
jgi:hypothetical protein